GRSRNQPPAGFHHSLHRRVQVALVLLKAAFAKKFAAPFVFNRQIAEAHQRPVADIAQESHPRLFFAEGPAANVACYLGIAPQCRAIRKILKPMPTQPQPLGLDHRNRSAQTLPLTHGWIYAQPWPKKRTGLKNGHYNPKVNPAVADISGSRNRRRSRSRLRTRPKVWPSRRRSQN